MTGCGNMLGSCRHERTCTGDVIYKYPGGVYHTAKIVFDRLEDEGIDVPEEERYYPYRATYDIEVMLQPKTRDDPRSWSGPVSRTTQRVCMFQRSYLYRAHLLCLRKVIPVRRWSPVCSI